MRAKQTVSIGYKTDGRIFISVSINSQRYRFSNGEAINQSISPNLFEGEERIQEAEALKAAYILALRNGWRPTVKVKLNPEQKSMIVIPIMRLELKRRLSGEYSRHYKKDLLYVVDKFEEFLIATGREDLSIDKLSASVIRDFLDSHNVSNRSKRNYKAYLSTLFKTIIEENGFRNPFASIKLSRTTEVLHKPFKDVAVVLNELYSFDKRLHLCCLLAYACLLRPHREVRELRWGEVSEDLSQISLSGARNKGKRNRIVPIPQYVKPFLEEFVTKGTTATGINVFTGTEMPYNDYFFATLWGKFKKKSQYLEPDQTMYSFRHGGALKVFEQSRSLVKLQQVMGHSSLQVSLTYLRGLEVKHLEVGDMPDLPMFST
jgi:integrase